jgi:Helix-turn-helix of DDE superfamily endonuclease
VIEIRDDRHMRSLTGLSQAQFEQLLPTFTLVYQETQQERYKQEVAAGTRQRQPGGGAKGKLPTPVDKLFFVLYYYKTYPTFDVLGTHFDMARSKANENLHKLSPLLHKTLGRLEMMPYREFKNPEALQTALKGVDRIIIDATERAYHRSQDEALQREHYSGKKKAIL